MAHRDVAANGNLGFAKAGIAILLSILALGTFLAGADDGIHLFQDQYGAYQTLVTTNAAGRLPLSLLTAALLIGTTWFCGSFIIATLTGTNLPDVLKRDAATFLPLAILLVSALRYIPGIAQVSSALFLASSTLARALLLTALLITIWLKYDLYRKLRPSAEPNRPSRLSDRATGWLVFLAVAAFFAAAIPPFSAAWPFGGDEPHYLMVTHSILKDGNVYFGDDYEQGVYREFTQWQRLTPQYLRKTTDGRIVPIHRIGMPLLAVPFFALAGKLGAVLMIGLMAALSAANVYWLVMKFVPHRAAALAATAWVTFSVPLLPQSFLFYTEVPLSLFTLLALNLIIRRNGGPPRLPWLIPFVIWTLPWLHQRGFITAVALSLILLFTLRKQLPAMAGIAALCLLLALTTPAWNLYLYGEFSLLAEMGGAQHNDISLWNIIPGFAGLLFDRNFGLLLNNPAVIPALIGLIPLWRRRRDAVVQLLLVVAFTIGPGLAYHMWWGGGSVAARYAAPVIALAAVPMAALLAEAAWRNWRKAALLLGALSIALAAVLILHPEIMTNERTATSRLLTSVSVGRFDAVEWWPSWFSPSSEFWTSAALLVAAAFAAALLIVAAVKASSLLAGKDAAGPASALAGLAVFLACLGIYGWIAEIVTPGEPNGHQPHSRERDLLYQQRWRHESHAVIDQGGNLRPDSLPSRGFSAQRLFSGWALERDEKVPGGRSLRLPAGERTIHLESSTPFWAGGYALEIGLRASVDSTALEIEVYNISDAGRDTVTPICSRSISLAADYGTVGIPLELPRNSMGLAIRFASQGEFRFTHATLQTLSLERLGSWRLPIGLFDKAAVSFNEYTLYCEPGSIYPPEGRWFWTKGGGEAALTIVSRKPFTALNIGLVGHPPVKARIRSGEVEESVAFGQQRSNATLELPVKPVESGGMHLVELFIRAEGSFVPAKSVEGSTDERALGVHTRITLKRAR
jgi:hypothetical protein